MWQLGTMDTSCQPAYTHGTGYPEAGYRGSSITFMTLEGSPTGMTDNSSSNVNDVLSDFVNGNEGLFCTQPVNNHFKSMEHNGSCFVASLMNKRGHSSNSTQYGLDPFKFNNHPMILENDQVNSKSVNFEYEYKNDIHQMPNSSKKDCKFASWDPPNSSITETCPSMEDGSDMLSELLNYESLSTKELVNEGIEDLMVLDLFYESSAVSPVLQNESSNLPLSSRELVPKHEVYLQDSGLEPGKPVRSLSLGDIDLLDFLPEPFDTPVVQPVPQSLPVQSAAVIPVCVQSVPTLPAPRFPAPLQPVHDAPKKPGRPKKIATVNPSQILPENDDVSFLPEGHPIPLLCMDQPARDAKIVCKRKITTSIIEDNISSSCSEKEDIPELNSLIPIKAPRRSLSPSDNEKRKKNNEASKKSRERKKAVEAEREAECKHLELINMKLKERCAKLQHEVELRMEMLKSLRKCS